MSLCLRPLFFSFLFLSSQALVRPLRAQEEAPLDYAVFEEELKAIEKVEAISPTMLPTTPPTKESSAVVEDQVQTKQAAVEEKILPAEKPRVRRVRSR